MGFTRTFLGKAPEEGITKADLEAFVARRIPESLNLEYKAKEALEEPARVSREIDALANSEGGLLVLGVIESKEHAGRFPERIGWDEDPKHSHEWIEAVVVQGIHPPVLGVRVVQVHDEAGGVVHLIDVPPSPSPPHMAPDGKYYYRTSSGVRSMEHYQVADAFGKRRRPVLRPALWVSGYDETKGSLRLRYALFNDGRAIAKWVFVQLTAVGCNIERESGKGVWSDVRHQTGDDGLEEWIITQESPLFVLHPGLMTSYEPVIAKITLPLALVTVLVGAEEAPTESYVGMLGITWLREQVAKRPGGEIGVPLLAVDHVDVEQVRAWEERFASDFRALSEQTAGKVGKRLLFAMGTKLLEAIIADAEVRPDSATGEPTRTEDEAGPAQ